MKKSDFQLDIEKTFLNSDKNIVIDACPGSGKSTTILNLIQSKVHKGLYLCFNRSIREEIDYKFQNLGITNCEASTFHSLGMKFLRRSKRVRVNKNKSFDLWKLFVKENKNTLFKNMPFPLQKKVMKSVFSIHDYYRNSMIPDLSSIASYLSNVLNQYVVDMEDECSSYKSSAKYPFIDYSITKIYSEFFKFYKKNLVQKGALVIDFPDMIFLPLYLKMNLSVRSRYNVLYVDEAQDLNLAQHSFIEKLNIKRFVAVGDERQCQPKGTKILMSDLTEKNIEDVREGDSVITYNKKKCKFIGYGKSHNVVSRKVLGKKANYRVDNVFTVNLENGYKSSYTSNHKCYVQINKNKSKDKYILYLMQQGNKFRLGIYTALSKGQGNCFGLTTRSTSEKADKSWVLKVYNTRQEAYFDEQYYSYLYNIPQTRFTDKANSKYFNQETINKFWKLISVDINNVKNLLKHFNKEFDYPIWFKTSNSRGGIGNFWNISSHAMFKTQACNIFPELMDMCIFDENNKDNKNRIRKKIVPISNVHVNKLSLQTFYSLSIEEDENYVADKILTGNSLYLFSGSKNNSIDIFRKKPNTIEMPLHICYRCPSNVIDEANKVYDIIVPFKDKSKNPISRFDEKHLSNIPSNSMVLCRKVAPLYDLYFKLINKGIDCFINDELFYYKIKKLAKDYSSQTLDGIIDQLDHKIEKISDDKKLSKEDKSFQIAMQTDLKKILTIIKNNTSIITIDELTEFFKNSSENREDSVMLSSIHKAKGLERDYVYLLNRNLIPDEHAISKEALVQENNLLFVAITRAKKEFNYLSIS